MAREVTLGQGVIKRLARLQARAEGAYAVAQAAEQAAKQAQGTLQQALTEECADEGMVIPQNEQVQVDIDWKTGVVRLQESTAEPVGTTPLPPGNGAVPAAEPAF